MTNRKDQEVHMSDTPQFQPGEHVTHRESGDVGQVDQITQTFDGFDGETPIVSVRIFVRMPMGHGFWCAPDELEAVT